MSRWDRFTDDELDAIVNAFEDAAEASTRTDGFDDTENKVYDEARAEWDRRGGGMLRAMLLNDRMADAAEQVARSEGPSDPGGTVTS